MVSKFAFQLDRDEYAVGLKSVLGGFLARNTLRWHEIVLGLAALVVPLIFWPDAFPAILAALAMFAITNVVWQRRVHHTMFEPAIATIEFTIDDQGLREERGGIVRVWPWTAVRQVLDQHAGVTIELAGLEHIFLPRRLFGDLSSEDLAAAIRERSPAINPPVSKSVSGRDALLLSGKLAAAIAMFFISATAFLLLGGVGLLYATFEATDRTHAAMAASVFGIGIGAAIVTGLLAHVAISRANRSNPRVAANLARGFIALLAAVLVAVMVLPTTCDCSRKLLPACAAEAAVDGSVPDLADQSSFESAGSAC